MEHLDGLIRKSVEDTMYLAGVWVRWVEDITEALWNTRVSSSTISDLNEKIYGKIEEWRMRPIHGEHPYIFLDGVYLKRSWGGEVSNVSVLVAVGVNEEGYREILGIAEESREDKESWTNFLRYLKNRGLSGVKLIVSDKCSGLHGIIGDFFPDAKWQRCVVLWYRNAFTMSPWKHVKSIAAMLKAIHAQEVKDAAREKAKLVIGKLRKMNLNKVAEFIESSVRDFVLYGLSLCALDTPAHEQCFGTDHERDSAQNPCNRSISGWLFRYDAGRRKTQTYFDNKMGNSSVFEHL